MNQIIFEDLGMNLGLTRITFIRERTPEEREELRRISQRNIINEAILGYHREQELNARIAEYDQEEWERQLFDLIRERVFIESIPDDFWEPVKITTEIENFNFINENWECHICREERNKKTQLKCCKQNICDYCVENWFNKESIHCPFCKKDIREIIE